MKNTILILAIVALVALVGSASADSQAPGMPKRVSALEAQVAALAGLPATVTALQTDVSALTGRVTDLETEASLLSTTLAAALDRIDDLEDDVLDLSGLSHPLTVHVGTVPANSIRTFVVKTEDLPGAIGETRTVAASWRTNNSAHGWTIARTLNTAGTQHQTLSGFGPCGSPGGLAANTFTYTKGVPPGGVHEFAIFNNRPIAGCQGGTISGLTFTFR